MSTSPESAKPVDPPESYAVNLGVTDSDEFYSAALDVMDASPLGSWRWEEGRGRNLALVLTKQDSSGRAMTVRLYLLPSTPSTSDDDLPSNGPGSTT